MAHERWFMFMEMPNEEILERMEDLLKVAGDFTRLKILYCIMDGEKSVGEIQEEAGVSQSLASHQIKVLKKANLLASRKEGTHVYYVLADNHVAELLKIVNEHVMEELQ